MFKRVIIGLLLSQTIVTAFAQTYQPPAVIPASPSTQNFLRYGEIPVDISTGVPNISVPIYTVKSAKLEFPISISYHASGIKVKDRASIVGLGWVLNATSFVNLTLMSKVDGYFRPFYANADSFAAIRERSKALNNLDSFRALGYLINTTVPERDYQTDRLFFKLPNGRSGHFRSDYLTGETVSIPLAPLKIDTLKHFDVGLNRYVIDGFKIKDETGAIYTFDLQAGVYGSPDYSLTSIISADKTDTIRLVYKSYKNQYYISNISAVVEAGDFRNPQSNAYYEDFTVEYRHSVSASNTLYTENILDSIVSNATVVKFNMTGDRLDSTIGYKLYRLSSVIVYDRFSGNQTKSFSFNQSYFGSSQDNNYRLRLDSLSISGRTSASVEKYRFSYDTIGVYYNLPPYPEKLYPGSGPFREDFWGYSNGSSSNSPVSDLFIPDSVITSVTYQFPVWKRKTDFLNTLGLTDKLPNYNYAGAAMLREIQYPTGGKTFFDFEPNEGRILLPSGTIINQGAGFRIHQIRNYTDSGRLAGTKTYEYNVARQKTISMSTYMNGQRVVGWGDGDMYIIPNRAFIYSNPLESLNIDNGPPVFYEKVTEYYGDATGNTGKTVYTYELPPSEYHYFDYVAGEYDGPKYRPPLEEDRGNYTPHLISKVDYRNDGTQYYPVSKTENQYAEFSSRKVYTGMQVIPETYYELSGWYHDYIYCDSLHEVIRCLTSADTKEYPYYMHHLNMYAKQCIEHLVQSKSYLYATDTSQQLVTTTVYKYDTLTHLQTLEQLTINSKGDTLKTKFKYPLDYAGSAVYDSMIARNIISPVVEQANYSNSNFLQSSKTNYYAWNTSFIAPQTVESKTLNNNSEMRLRFNAYDSKGNILSVSKENDVKISYLWDYDNSYPIAEVINADTGQIAYTSFEADGKGKWSFSSSPAVDYSTVSGKKIYTLTGSNNITKSGLNSGTTYVVSYWTTKGSAYSITGTISGYPIGGRTVNGWKYFEHRITGQTSVTLSGTGTIDELRLFPLNAQMTTYTYEPSVGIKSQCDANNFITYYEYDYFNRLLAVHDQDKNILKKVCYNYTGQPEACQFFTNTSQSGNYYSQVCASGETPVAYWVDVPEGMFTSTDSVGDANNQALQYAQNLANQNGGCILVTTLELSNYTGNYYWVGLHNTESNEWYGTWLFAYDYDITLNVPEGTYNIYVSFDTQPYPAWIAACGYSTYGTDATFFNVTVNYQNRHITMQD